MRRFGTKKRGGPKAPIRSFRGNGIQKERRTPKRTVVGFYQTRESLAGSGETSSSKGTSGSVDFDSEGWYKQLDNFETKSQ